MTDLVLPQALRVATSGFKYIDATGVTRGIYTGVPQTTAYGGDRIGVTLGFTPFGGFATAEKTLRARLLALLMRLRGKQNRIYIADDSNTRRGTFPATELFVNADFSNGTANWTAQGTLVTSASDGVLRGTLTSAPSSTPAIFQSVTAVPYIPYCLRSVILEGAGLSGLSVGNFFMSANYSTTLRGYRVVANVPVVAGNSAFPLVIPITSGAQSGAFADVGFTSIARCMLADGGGNLALRSDELNTGDWTATRTTKSNDVHTAPNGQVLADKLTEDGTPSNTHIVFQSGSRTAAVADLCSYGYFLRSAGTRNVALIVGNNTSDYVRAIFDLGTGTPGTVSNVGTATNGRSFMVSVGNGWYFCTVVGQMASAATWYWQASMLSGTSESYSGDSTSALGTWRLGIIQSSVPTRGAQTTTAAVAPDATPQTGSALYIKGGRTPSEGALAGALLAGDWVEIDGQLKMLTAPLDLDAAGMGYLQFSPPLRRAVADNTPIIVHRPMGRFMVADGVSWMNDPGVVSSATIDLEEAFG